MLAQTHDQGDWLYCRVRCPRKSLRTDASTMTWFTRIVDFLLIVALSIGFGWLQLDNRVPQYDENVYIGYAWNLHAHDIYGLARNASTPAPPGGGVAPLYPWVMKMLMRMDSSFEQSIRCHIERGSQSCLNDLRTARRAQLIFVSLMLGLLCVALTALCESRMLSVLACALIILTGAPVEYANHQLTETLYPVPAMLAVCLTALHLTRHQYRYLVIAGLVFGLCALTRPNYWYAGLMLAPLLGVARLFTSPARWSRRLVQGTVSCLVFAIALIAVVSPWLLRNHHHFGKASVTVGYGAQALSSRLSYNEMTNAEFRAGWIYFLPDFGDSLAKRLFPREQYERLAFGNPTGFLGIERTRIRDEIAQATGVRPAHNAVGTKESQIGWALTNYAFNDPVQHFRVSALLAWRGFFVEKLFGLVGGLSLLLILIFSSDRWLKRDLILLLLPALLVLGFNANVSVNIPRYNPLLLLPMAIAMSTILRGFAAQLMPKARARR